MRVLTGCLSHQGEQDECGELIREHGDDDARRDAVWSKVDMWAQMRWVRSCDLHRKMHLLIYLSGPSPLHGALHFEQIR